jgi:integrase
MLRKTVDRVRARLNIEPFAPHDLRRTCATSLGKMQVPGHIIERILNHKQTGVTNTVYNKYDYLKERREALDAWGKRVAQIVSGIKPVEQSRKAEP